jgi:prepilin-type N-terminal cleavage/methylation domain-containing protein
MKKIPGLKTMFRSQRGFTLLEIIVAIVITTVLGTAAATATIQITRLNAKTMNRQVAINQVENAVHYLSRDLQQAQQIVPETSGGVALPLDSVPTGSKAITFNLIPATGHLLVIKWIDWNDNSAHQITYSLDSSGNLLRNDIPVANGITAAAGVWHTDTKALNFTPLTATTGTGATQTTETRTFQINPRPAQ